MLKKTGSFCHSMLHRKSFEKTHHCAMYCPSFYLWMVCTVSHPCTTHLEKPGTTHVLHIYKKEVSHSLTLGRLRDMYIDAKGQTKVKQRSKQIAEAS